MNTPKETRPSLPFWTQPTHAESQSMFGLPWLQGALGLLPSPGPHKQCGESANSVWRGWAWECTELHWALLQRSQPKWERQLLLTALGLSLTTARRWSSRSHLPQLWWPLLSSVCVHATTGRWRRASMALGPHSCTGLKSLFCFITLRFF